MDVLSHDFVEICLELAATVHDYAPDLVIGIERGGARVAEEMLEALGQPEYVAVRVQRPGTQAKSSLRLGGVISRLPRIVTEHLRWLEVEVREQALRTDRSPAGAEWAGSDELLSALTFSRSFQRIVVVDDTIDSGRTVTVVREALRRTCPGAEVRIAVLASTWRNPPVRPDYCLHDRTLLRLPWSLDAVGRS